MTEMKPPRCPRCDRAMDRGVILDRTQPYLGVMPSTWMEGPAERSFWVGLKTSGREQHDVVTFRCDGCGYLESYAPASPGSSP